MNIHKLTSIEKSTVTILGFLTLLNLSLHAIAADRKPASDSEKASANRQPKLTKKMTHAEFVLLISPAFGLDDPMLRATTVEDKIDILERLGLAPTTGYHPEKVLTVEEATTVLEKIRQARFKPGEVSQNPSQNVQFIQQLEKALFGTNPPPNFMNEPTIMLPPDGLKALITELDNQVLSEECLTLFETCGVTLSQKAEVSVEEKNSRWLITEKKSKSAYIIRREEAALDIYQKLSSFGSDFEPVIADLDNRVVSEACRHLFETRGITLPQAVTVSIEEPGNRWLIATQENRPTYMIRREAEGLNIYRRRMPFEIEAATTPVTPTQTTPAERISRRQIVEFFQPAHLQPISPTDQ